METRHGYKVHDADGRVRTITIRVWEDRVHKDYYRGRWRHVCNWEPMFTRKQASEDTLMMVLAEKEWPEKKDGRKMLEDSIGNKTLPSGQRSERFALYRLVPTPDDRYPARPIH